MPRRPVWNRSAFSGALESFQSAISRVPGAIDSAWKALGAIARVLALGLSVGAAIYTYRELTRDILVIEPISVPKQYADAGITPEVMAKRIKDVLTDIEATTKTSMRKEQLGLRSDELAAPDIEVPGTKLGLKTLLEMTRAIIPFLPQPKSAGGEITLSALTRPGMTKDSLQDAIGEKVQITLRIKRHADSIELITISPLANDSETIARSAAEAVLRQVNPYVLGAYRLDHGDADSAKAIVESIINDPSQDQIHRVAAYNLWGEVLYDQNKYDEAIVKFQTATEMDPKYAFAYNNWGNALYDQNKYDEAIVKYQKAIELDPKNAVAYNNWGTALERQNKYDEAIVKYQKAIELDPKYAFPYNNWGLALYKQKKYDEAITKYRKAIEADPKYEHAYHNWGLALDGLGRPAEAQEKYAKARELQ